MKTLRAHLLLMLVVVAVAVYESRAADTNSDAATGNASSSLLSGIRRDYNAQQRRAAFNSRS
jgi:hypothetical protein